MASHSMVVAYLRRLARAYNVPPNAAVAAADAMDPDAFDGIDWRAVVDGLVTSLRNPEQGDTPPIVPGWEWNGNKWVRDNAGDQGGNGGQGPGGGDGGGPGDGGGQGGPGPGPGGTGGGQGGGGGPSGPGGDISPGELRSILSGYGLNPRAFDDLIHEAIAGQWTPYQFEAALYGSPQFHKMFPGIFNPDGSLKMTPGQYLQLTYGPNGYEDIAREFGIATNRKKIGMLIEGNVSPDEWAFRAELRQYAKENEPFREAFNAQIAAAGGEPLDRGDWFKFLAGSTTQELENLWEATSLKTTQGINLTPEEANAVAKQVGKPGERVDLNQIVNQVRSIKDFIAPELQGAGVSDADLVVLESGADPKNLGPRLQQILNNRKALLSGPRTRMVVSGGGAFPAAREGA